MSSGNLFLDPGPELAAAVEEIVAAMAQVAGLLPASAQADLDSYYALGEGRSLGQTQADLLERTGYVAVLARAVGMYGIRLSPHLLEQVHEGIFRPVFGERTLGFRTPPARGDHREDDGVVYPIWVVDGTGRAPRIVAKRGSLAKQVRRRVHEACVDFERGVVAAVSDGQSEVDRSEGARLLARLYVRVIRIHPFADGNGRTAWVALQYGAGRLRFPVVPASPTMEARLALGDAIRDGRNIDRLSAYIERAAWGT